MRFADADYDNPGELDFVPRERRGQITNVVIAFAVALALIFTLIFLPHDVVRSNHAAMAAMAIVVGLCFYIVYRKQQNLDLVMHTEYQNMLFAQAAALGSSFCMFVRRDGTIVYANDGLSLMFPQIHYAQSQALQSIFEQGGVQGTDRDRIMSAIYNTKSERIVFPLTNAKGERKDYIMTLEPLQRPGGFMVIRGREYRDQRAGVQLLPDVLRSTSADKLDHLLSSTPTAHYVTDAYGRFEYVNPAMDQLLGYEPGEIISSKLSIQQILYQINNQPLTEDYTPQNYSGTALLKKKQGALAQVTLSQNVSRDAQGKMMGTTGSAVAQSGKP